MLSRLSEHEIEARIALLKSEIIRLETGPGGQARLAQRGGCGVQALAKLHDVCARRCLACGAEPGRAFAARVVRFATAGCACRLRRGLPTRLFWGGIEVKGWQWRPDSCRVGMAGFIQRTCSATSGCSDGPGPDAFRQPERALWRLTESHVVGCGEEQNGGGRPAGWEFV